MLLPILFTAALEARYAYDPPDVLSPVEPTREDMMPMRGLDDLSILGRSACVKDNGPIVLTENVLLITAGFVLVKESCSGGYIMPTLEN